MSVRQWLVPGDGTSQAVMSFAQSTLDYHWAHGKRLTNVWFSVAPESGVLPWTICICTYSMYVVGGPGYALRYGLSPGASSRWPWTFYALKTLAIGNFP